VRLAPIVLILLAAGSSACGQSGSPPAGEDARPAADAGADDAGACRDHTFVPGSLAVCAQGTDEQTGWPGFCTRAALVTDPVCTFTHPLELWVDEFDQRRDDPSYFDSVEKTRLRATTCRPCEQEPYGLHRIFKALLTMHAATGRARYLDEAIDLADRMIAAAVPYDPAWASPRDREAFDAWVAEHGTIRFWNADACAPATQPSGYRYTLNELQGLRGISLLARTLARAGDARWRTYADFAEEFLGFYAALGVDGTPLLPGAVDKNEHYVLNALDLYDASGDAKYLQWATAINASILASGSHVDGDFIDMRVSLTGEGALIGNDTSHANRGVELFRAWHERPWFPQKPDIVRLAVNTLLFRIWEGDPTVRIDDVAPYPALFRNFVSGANGCVGPGDPPYRTGSVGMGWHELARHDRRVLYLVERLTLGLLDETVPLRFPAGDGCVANGNTNYSHLLVLLAELAYAHTVWSPDR
jgi:hypothetical protein